MYFSYLNAVFDIQGKVSGCVNILKYIKYLFRNVTVVFSCPGISIVSLAKIR